MSELQGRELQGHCPVCEANVSAPVCVSDRGRLRDYTHKRRHESQPSPFIRDAEDKGMGPVCECPTGLQAERYLGHTIVQDDCPIYMVALRQKPPKPAASGTDVAQIAREWLVNFDDGEVMPVHHAAQLLMTLCDALESAHQHVEGLNFEAAQLEAKLEIVRDNAAAWAEKYMTQSTELRELERQLAEARRVLAESRLMRAETFIRLLIFKLPGDKNWYSKSSQMVTGLVEQYLAGEEWLNPEAQPEAS